MDKEMTVQELRQLLSSIHSYMEHGTLSVGYERNWNIGEPIDLKKQKLHRERER